MIKQKILCTYKHENTYPKFFNKRSRSMLQFLSKNEAKIDYKNLSYKAYFNGEDNFRFHEIVNLKKYGIL